MRHSGFGRELSTMLKENTTVSSLGLTLSDPTLTGVVSMLAKIPGRMRALHLSHATLPEVVCGSVASMLALKSCSLTALDLTYAYAQDAGAAALARSLRANGSLISLTLAHNAIAQAGTRALAEALRSNATLTQLSLHANHLTDALDGPSSAAARAREAEEAAMVETAESSASSSDYETCSSHSAVIE
jgi:hypothetical protein